MIIVHKLIQLSKIFKKGFTIELKDNQINQYSNIEKPFIVSYLTIIEIKNNKPLFKNIQHIPTNCIIGGWEDKTNNTYYIELNKSFNNIKTALIFAYKFNQKAIYNLKTQKTIELKNFIGKRYLNRQMIVCANCGYEITEQENIFDGEYEETYICPKCRYEGYNPNCDYIKNH